MDGDLGAGDLINPRPPSLGDTPACLRVGPHLWPRLCPTRTAAVSGAAALFSSRMRAAASRSR